MISSHALHELDNVCLIVLGVPTESLYQDGYSFRARCEMSLKKELVHKVLVQLPSISFRQHFYKFILYVNIY